MLGVSILWGLSLQAGPFEKPSESLLDALGGPSESPRGDKTSLEKKKSFYQIVTGETAEEGRQYWDAKYNTETYVYGKDPAVFLTKMVSRMPLGMALDIAMGEGRNAVYLAKKGFRVEGVDISKVGLRKARRLAKENNVTVGTINADLNHYEIVPEKYEVILNINFLMRSLVPKIKRGLKPGGVVLFENYTRDHLKNPDGRGMNPDWLLRSGELRELFSDLEILHYEEKNEGGKAVASLLAQKPEKRAR